MNNRQGHRGVTIVAHILTLVLSVDFSVDISIYENLRMHFRPYVSIVALKALGCWQDKKIKLIGA